MCISYYLLLTLNYPFLYLSPFNGMSTTIFQPLTQQLICQEGRYRHMFSHGGQNCAGSYTSVDLR